jgi:MFS family permease
MREQLRVVIAVARDPGLARIELAYLGFNMAEYATWMAILVYAYGLGGAGTAALFALVQLIPAGIVAPFLASLGDRFPADRVLVVGYTWQAAALGLTAAAMYAGAPPLVTLIVAALASTSFTITRPVQAVILPSLTHAPSDLTAANAVSGLAENVGIFIGPLIGGILLGARAETGDVFATFAVTSVVAVMLVPRVPAGLGAASADAATKSAGGIRAALGASLGGFGVLTRSRPVLLLVLVIAATEVVIGALDILFVATAIDLLGAGEAWAGFLYAAFGLGGILGAIATVALIGRARMTPTLTGSGGLFGLPITAIAVVPATATAPLLFAASGAGFSIVMVAGRTLLQRVAPEAQLARVFGVLEGLTMFALAVGSLASGLVISTLGVGWALVGAGLLVPAILLAAWFKLGAIDRDARPPDPEALALLRRIPIFAPMSATSIERILAELIRLDIPAGATLIRQGDVGDRFYVLAEGRVRIERDGVLLRENGPGDYFGEIALLRDVLRTATVTALTPLRVIAIERDRFLEAVTGHSQSRQHAEAVVAARL